MRKLIALLLAMVLLCSSAGFAEALDTAATEAATADTTGEDAAAEETVLTPADIALMGRPVSTARPGMSVSSSAPMAVATLTVTCAPASASRWASTRPSVVPPKISSFIVWPRIPWG